MTARACLLRKIETGRVSRKKAEALLALWDERAGVHQPARGPQGAATQATVEVTQAWRRRTQQLKRRRLKALQAQSTIAARAADNPGRAASAMFSVLDFDPTGRVAGLNVSMTARTIRGEAHAMIVDFLNEFRSKAAGLMRRKAGTDNIVRELFGEATGDAEAKQLAGGIATAFEHLRRRFNAAGGDIPKRQDWGLPQHHDRRALATLGETKQEKIGKWVAFVEPRLDRSQMIDLDSGLPMSDAKLRQVLEETFETIVTDGVRDVQPGGFAQRSIVRRRQESRFLIFRNADTWLEYQREFGSDDLLSLVLGEIDVMARDTAIIEMLGPNPEATLRFMENLIDRAESDRALEGGRSVAGRAVQKIGAPKAFLRAMWNVVSGHTGRPANELFANISQANRNVLNSAILGGAFFSALSDPAFSSVAARANGMPVARVLARHLKLFSPGSNADRRQAIRLGFTAEGWATHAIAAQRYVGEVTGPEWSRRLVDTVLRMSWLSPWTQAGRWAFATEFLGFLTENVGNRLGDLPPKTRDSFRRHGLSTADWDELRQLPLWRDPETGAEFLRPQDVVGALPEDTRLDTPLFRRRQELATKLMSMIVTEQDFAVPTVTTRARAALTAGTQPGTVWGEIIRNTTLLKSFPVTLVATHLMRMVSQPGLAGKGKYLAHLVLATMVMGVLGEQLSQIRRGKDPIAIDDVRLWIKGLARGGGLGIIGDFLFSDVNRFGGGIIDTLAGPVAGEIDLFTRLTAGNVQDLAKEGEFQNFGIELQRFVERILPGRSLWWSELALERLVLDELQKVIDPGYAERFQRIEQRARDETGQEFFSPPGSGFPPPRAPDLAAGLGE